MSRRQRWTKEQATTVLERNGAYFGMTQDGKPEVTATQPGILLLGAIDYLRSEHGYVWTRVKGKR